jgi:hypothetical protein
MSNPLHDFGEKRLGLRNLRKFRVRRKALEGGRKHGMNVGGAARRLIEPHQRQRCAQVEAPRLLSLRNVDGGEEASFGCRRIRGTALKQNVAADAMGFRFEPALSITLGVGQNFVDARERGIDRAEPTRSQNITACRCVSLQPDLRQPFRNLLRRHSVPTGVTATGRGLKLTIAALAV